MHLPHGEVGAFDAVQVAVDSGADGVFLINQGMSANEVWGLLPKVKTQFPHLLVGVNLLGEDPGTTMLRPGVEQLDALWSDDCGVDALDEALAAQAQARWQTARATAEWKGAYFGGTAFKTQADIPSSRLAGVACRAALFVDVVTTSGRGTGVAIDPQKARLMKTSLGHHRLAVASGVTPDNVEALLPFVDDYLVATGIESSFGVLDPMRTRALCERIHG